MYSIKNTGYGLDVSEDVFEDAWEMECHIPVVLLVNTSSSMAGKPIEELNQGLIEFGKALIEDRLARVRADVCVISFNSEVRTEVGFRPAAQYEAPVLKAGGLTSMNEAIIAGLNAIEERKQEYLACGISWSRPWLFVLSDGIVTDTQNEAEAKAMLRKAISERRVIYRTVGIGAYADIARLLSYYPADETQRLVFKATAENFKDSFCFINEEPIVAHPSDYGRKIELPPVPSELIVGI